MTSSNAIAQEVSFHEWDRNICQRSRGEVPVPAFARRTDLHSPQTSGIDELERTRKHENTDMGKCKYLKRFSQPPKPQISKICVVTITVTCHRRHVHDKSHAGI